MKVQKIPMPPGLSRVETGALQFGDDWPGYHLRGDAAFHVATAIRDVVAYVRRDPIAAVHLRFDLAALEMMHTAIMFTVIVRDPTAPTERSDR